MKRLLFIAAVLALATARPELYKETEDFQYSRSSSDEVSKSGFYGAQKGNMGGNYERAHNMDGLAQHQMSTAVRQVEGELGDAANTRTGSVFTSANSRGVYGSGRYDLSNLQGRNFQEGIHEGAQTHSSLSSQHGYSGHSTLHNSRYNGLSHGAGYNEHHGLTHGHALESSNLQAANSGSDANYNYGQATSHSSGYHAQSGYHSQSAYDSSSASQQNLYSGSVAQPQNRLIVTTPVKIVGRPGQRVALPLGVQTYGATHSSSIIDQNAIDASDAEVFNSDQSAPNRPTQNGKHYESSYSYRKQWEKHDVKPEIIALSTPTENPFSKNSELYDDTQAAKNQYHASGYNSHSGLSSAQHNVYDSSVKSSVAQSQYHKTASSLQTNLETDSNTNAHTHGAYQSGMTDGTNALGDIDTKPKSYHSSYSYHKAWERQGDPYVIIPVSGAQHYDQRSQKLATATNSHDYSSHQQHGSQYHQSHGGLVDCDCDETGHVRVARSYGSRHEQRGDIGQQAHTGWDNTELVQQEQKTGLQDFEHQSQNKWDRLENLGQHNQHARIEDFGQQSQMNNWDDLRQQTQTNREDLRQQTQTNWDNMRQQTQSGWDNLGQQTENKWDNFGQQTRNHWRQVRKVHEPIKEKQESQAVTPTLIRQDDLQKSPWIRFGSAKRHDSSSWDYWDRNYITYPPLSEELHNINSMPRLSMDYNEVDKKTEHNDCSENENNVWDQIMFENDQEHLKFKEMGSHFFDETFFDDERKGDDVFDENDVLLTLQPKEKNSEVEINDRNDSQHITQENINSTTDEQDRNTNESNSVKDKNSIQNVTFSNTSFYSLIDSQQQINKKSFPLPFIIDPNYDVKSYTPKVNINIVTEQNTGKKNKLSNLLINLITGERYNTEKSNFLNDKNNIQSTNLSNTKFYNVTDSKQQFNNKILALPFMIDLNYDMKSYSYSPKPTVNIGDEEDINENTILNNSKIDETYYNKEKSKTDNAKSKIQSTNIRNNNYYNFIESQQQSNKKSLNLPFIIDSSYDLYGPNFGIKVIPISKENATWAKVYQAIEGIILNKTENTQESQQNTDPGYLLEDNFENKKEKSPPTLFTSKKQKLIHRKRYIQQSDEIKNKSAKKKRRQHFQNRKKGGIKAMKNVVSNYLKPKEHHHFNTNNFQLLHNHSYISFKLPMKTKKHTKNPFFYAIKNHDVKLVQPKQLVNKTDKLQEMFSPELKAFNITIVRRRQNYQNLESYEDDESHEVEEIYEEVDSDEDGDHDESYESVFGWMIDHLTDIHKMVQHINNDIAKHQELKMHIQKHTPHFDDYKFQANKAQDYSDKKNSQEHISKSILKTTKNNKQVPSIYGYMLEERKGKDYFYTKNLVEQMLKSSNKKIISSKTTSNDVTHPSIYDYIYKTRNVEDYFDNRDKQTNKSKPLINTINNNKLVLDIHDDMLKASRAKIYLDKMNTKTTSNNEEVPNIHDYMLKAGTAKKYLDETNKQKQIDKPRLSLKTTNNNVHFLGIQDYAFQANKAKNKMNAQEQINKSKLSLKVKPNTNARNSHTTISNKYKDSNNSTKRRFMTGVGKLNNKVNFVDKFKQQSEQNTYVQNNTSGTKQKIQLASLHYFGSNAFKDQNKSYHTELANNNRLPDLYSYKEEGKQTDDKTFFGNNNTERTKVLPTIQSLLSNEFKSYVNKFIKKLKKNKPLSKQIATLKNQVMHWWWLPMSWMFL